MAEPTDTDKKKPRIPITRSTWLYIGSIVILVIVVVTFVGAPVITSTVGGRSLVFGSYDGEDIVYKPGNFFARQYEVVAQSLRDAGNGANLELQIRLAWREAFNRAVLHKAVLHTASDAGMVVSESKVDKMIAQDPRFLVNGRFDADAYRNTGNQERFSMRNFHRENAKFDQVVQDSLTGTQFSSAERDFVAAMTGPQRSFDVVRFPFSEFPEAQVELFVNENRDLFTRLDLAVVTLAEREEADRIRGDAMTPGNPFSNLARTYSRDLYADQDGEMGEVFGYELQQELTNPSDLDVLLALKEGDISEPVETTSGWSFYQAMSNPVVPAADNSQSTKNSGVLTEARSYMQIYEQGRIQDFVRAEAEQFAAAARTDGLEARAAQVRRKVLSTGFFPINYGNLQFFGQIQSSDIPDLSDAAYRDSFFQAAFTLAADEISDPILLRQSAVVLKLRGERPAPEESREFIVDYYEAIARQFYSQGIETAFIKEDLLKDNFNQAFTRYVMGN